MKRIAAILLSLAAAVTTVTAAAADDELKLVQISVTARSTGNLILEQLILRRLMIEATPDIAAAARGRLARNALARGEYAETIRLLNSGDGTEDQESPQIRRDRALIGEAYRHSGDIATATQILNDILSSMPDPAQPDDAALAAVKSLDEIPGDIAESEHFRRAAVYQFNRYWPEARRHFELVKTMPDAPEAAFQIGRGYSQDRQFAEAIPLYQRVIDEFPGTQQAKDALLQLAGAYARLGRNDEAIARYQTFIDKYPTDEKLERAYLNPVDIYRDLGDDAKALEWCRRGEDAFRGKRGEALAIFAEAKIYASRGEWDNEMSLLDRLKRRNDLGGPGVPGGTTLEEVASMWSYAFRQQAAIDGKVVPGPGLPAKIKAEYPNPHAEMIVRGASQQNIDPRLLLAIMRQESRFDPNARSNAAARGLMQFTHPSAQKLATELGWTSFDDEELYSPENSITLACQYLADLFTMFPNQPEAVVASYNGGEDNVKRWIARSKSNEPERYVPEFVFGQTKDYVQRVMANYRVYQQLYDGQLKPR